jgi:uncharacterized protein YbbC (DUF1343 family)
MNRLLLAALLLVSSTPLQAADRVLTGLDVLERDGFAPLRGKRIGIIGNHTSKDAAGRAIVDIFVSTGTGVTVAALFSPEHGYTGTSDTTVSSSTLTLEGRIIPIHSLYGERMADMRPKPEQLKDLDALVFDIQDIGSRFYTYIATMGLAMEEAAKAGMPFYVLDRPNPITGVVVEGPVLDDLSLRQVTMTAYFPVPVRHGMTPGEIASLFNDEIHGKLTVVKLEGWKRSMWYDETGLPWIAPSPNMPDLEAALMYSGIAIFESSNIAVGRGTPVPFRWIGAPWLDAERVAREAGAARLPGVEFSTQTYTPTRHHFTGVACPGVRMTITDREAVRPVHVFRVLERAIRRAHPKEFVWKWNEVKRMIGTARFEKLVGEGAGDKKIKKLIDDGPKDFEKTRRRYLLYR